MPDVTWRSPEAPGSQAADDPLRAGDWMPFGPDQVADLDVIIGERPGGQFNAFLMVEKQGETYPKDSRGRPIFPIFRQRLRDRTGSARRQRGFGPSWRLSGTEWLMTDDGWLMAVGVTRLAIP